MNIYISGISGTGMGPLALMAKAAGFNVCGSDLHEGAIYDELKKAGIETKIGEQDGEFLKNHLEGLDWFVYTSALPGDHPELVLAKNAGIKCTKRDEFTAFLVEKLGLKMIAVAGTHGKTTTTAMVVWAALKLGLPVAYIVGTTLGFAPSGSYKEGDKYFIYEADEYDRNFLKYHPWLAVIPAVSYDHPDIYPTKEDYLKAFEQFKSQSDEVIEKPMDGDFKLAGEARRLDAGLAAEAIYRILPEKDRIISVLNEFPGVGRRFEKLADGIYTDYAHHPEEIAATMDVARDEAELKEKKGVVVVYQPHQNTRQHEVIGGYYDAFVGAEKIFWLPTYLTRENAELPVLTPYDFIEELTNGDVAEPADLNDELFDAIMNYRDDGYLVVLMTAGPADSWLREKLARK
jgi:UDP-N-acetylmuramate--alanine ligase